MGGSCAAPVSGHVLQRDPAWGLNRRASLLPPSWSALLKQNLSDVNRNDTRTGIPVLSLLCSDGIFLLKRSTEGNNITSSSSIWTHYTDLAAWRAQPPWQHSEEKQQRQFLMKWHRKRAKSTKKGFFHLYCVCMYSEYTEKCAINNIQKCRHASTGKHWLQNSSVLPFPRIPCTKIEA